ncbi:GNAT family N-acetyltransferase [Gammaproteobacteria bacterium]|nr:GNAT family N-acetyltransferase [Gammaproteobacteria bacterium]
MNKIYRLQQIETPRLLIRPVKLGDEYAINKAINNSLKILQKWQTWAKDPGIEATRSFVQRGVFAWESGSAIDFPMVVIHKEDQKIIAASGYNDRSDVNQGLYETGYWCDVDYQGKGYVTEYANALTRYAFDALGASKVVILMQVENDKSIAVAERLNFTNEGIKARDPMNVVSEQQDKNYIYAVNNADNLPDLKYSWTNTESEANQNKIISWAKQTLKINDDKLFANSKAIVNTPWSNVLEINTGNDIVYLKQTPINLFLESEIIKLLRDKCDIKTIPNIIADNKKEHCFLMKKCGDISLRYHFDGKLQVDILKQAIINYKAIQHSTIEYIDELIALGVPDWRLDKFPALYNELISNAEYLNANRLNIEQQRQLHHYKGGIKNLCDELYDFGIAETLNHSDFHDNNILYDKANYTTAIIDLGETAINHPLFSLHACIEAAKNRYKLAEDSSEYKSLQRCTFDRFLDEEEHFNRAIEIISLLFPVYLLFAQKRFLDAIHMPFDSNNPLSVKQHEKITKGFIWFIENMEAANAK